MMNEHLHNVTQRSTESLHPSSVPDGPVQGGRGLQHVPACTGSEAAQTDKHISSSAVLHVGALWEETQTLKSTVQSTASRADPLLYIPAVRSLTLVFWRLRNILDRLAGRDVRLDKRGLLKVQNSLRTSTHPLRISGIMS